MRYRLKTAVHHRLHRHRRQQKEFRYTHGRASFNLDRTVISCWVRTLKYSSSSHRPPLIGKLMMIKDHYSMPLTFMLRNRKVFFTARRYCECNV